MSKMRIKSRNLTMQELKEDPEFITTLDWVDTLSENPQVIVKDENRLIFYIWFGGESHYVHEYSPEGKELDVFSFGFEKNRLEPKEVLEMIERRLNDPEY